MAESPGAWGLARLNNQAIRQCFGAYGKISSSHHLASNGHRTNNAEDANGLRAPSPLLPLVPEHSVVHCIDSVCKVLSALFLASIGLVMSPHFLWDHIRVLAIGALGVLVLKTWVVGGVIYLFQVPLRISFAVGLTMAHIGEFSFVLLSMAHHLKLLSPQVSGMYTAACGRLLCPCDSNVKTREATVTGCGLDYYPRLVFYHLFSPRLPCRISQRVLSNRVHSVQRVIWVDNALSLEYELWQYT